MVKQFYLCKGPWKNWKCSLDDATKRNVDTVRWGTKASSAPDISNYNNMKIGDKVFFANNTKDPGPFSESVIFGFGNVVEKIEGTEPYWPDEKEKNKVIYKYRFDVKRTFLTLNVKDAVKWFSGLPQPKGFSPIRNKDMLKKLEAGFSQHGVVQQSTFSFVEKDFEIEATSENDRYRTGRFRKLLEALKSSLSDSFENTNDYVNMAGKQGTKKGQPKEYRDHTWLSIYFGESRDTLQFQASLSAEGVAAFINCDATSRKCRIDLLTAFEEHKAKCFDILKNFDDDWYVTVRSKNTSPKWKATGLKPKTEWNISQLKPKDLEVIIEYLRFARFDLEIGKKFSKKKTLEMKTAIVSEFSDTFEKLLPLQRFLTEQNSEQITNDLDKKFEEWLKRGARKAGQSIEEYAKDLGKEEIEDRHKKFSELKKVLDEEPIDLTKISPVLKEALAEHPTWMTLEPLEGNEISDAITALKKYKDETNIHSFLSIMNQARPPGREGAGKSERRTGLETAQNLLIASVCLTALHPSEFVDFRENRWQNLAKLIRIEDEFAPVKTCPDKKRLEEVGKFAKTITETPTFKKYWGNQQEPLWTLAGICWRVKGDKPEGGNTNMDELVEEILQMEEYKLAIDKNVVKRIIRHLRGGKNVVLVGAPGVGKTELARKILKIVGKEDNETEKFVERVAHAEWTRQHVVGGLNLQEEFEAGCVTLAAQNKQWLLIDEFNRADINKAFGEMFLGIESHTIQLTPKEVAGCKDVEVNDDDKVVIPPEFRMVCTMNDYDKNLLLTELSFGLITRFAFVDIKPNEEEELDSIKAQLYKDRKINSNDYEKCKGVVEKFYDFIKDVRAAKHERMIGVRTCVDVFKYTVSASKEEGKINPEVFLDEALCDYVLPQFDRLDKYVIESAIAAAKANLPSVEKSKFIESLKRTLIRLKELTSWFDDKSEEEDFIVDKNLEPSGKKTRGKNPKRVEGGKRAWKTSPKLRAKKKSTKSGKNR